MKIIYFILIVYFPSILYAQQASNLTINEKISKNLWAEFGRDEQILILSKYPNIEIISSESIGQIQSAQVANRSTQSTNGGAILGSAVGQALYLDRAFSGSGNNYSAASHLGAGILGGILGSSLDQKAESMFIINYGVKALDGQIREVRVGSADEFTRPLGQCVYIPSLEPAPNSLCTENKIQFLKRLSSLAKAPHDALIMRENSKINIKCNVPGIGLMTLEKNSCIQMEGKIEQ